MSSQSRSLKLLQGIQFPSCSKGGIVWRQNACVPSDSVQRCFQQDNLHRTHNSMQIASMLLACLPPVFLSTPSSHNCNSCYSYLQKRCSNKYSSLSKDPHRTLNPGKNKAILDMEELCMVQHFFCMQTSLWSTLCAFVHRRFNCLPVTLISLEKDPPPPVIHSLEHSLMGTSLRPCFSLHSIVQ